MTFAENIRRYWQEHLMHLAVAGLVAGVVIGVAIELVG